MGGLVEYDQKIERTLQSVRRALRFETANNAIIPVDKTKQEHQGLSLHIPIVIPPLLTFNRRENNGGLCSTIHY